MISMISNEKNNGTYKKPAKKKLSTLLEGIKNPSSTSVGNNRILITERDWEIL